MGKTMADIEHIGTRCLAPHPEVLPTHRCSPEMLSVMLSCLHLGDPHVIFPTEHLNSLESHCGCHSSQQMENVDLRSREQ